MADLQVSRGIPCPSCGRYFEVAADGFIPQHFQVFADYKMLCSASETFVARAENLVEKAQQYRSGDRWKPVFQSPVDASPKTRQQESEKREEADPKQSAEKLDRASITPKVEKPRPEKSTRHASKRPIRRSSSRERAPLILTPRKNGKVKCPDCLRLVVPDEASQRLPRHGLGGNHVCRSSLRLVVLKENPHLRRDQKPKTSSDTPEAYRSTKKKSRKQPITLTPEEQKAREERIRQTIAKYRIRTPEELRALRGETVRNENTGDTKSDSDPTKRTAPKRRRRRRKKKKGQNTEYIRVYYGGLPGSGKRR